MRIYHINKIPTKKFAHGQLPSESDYFELIDSNTRINMADGFPSSILCTKVDPEACTYLREMFFDITNVKKGGLINKLVSDDKDSYIVQSWLDLLNKLAEPLSDLKIPAFNDMYYFRDANKPYHFDTIPSVGSYTAILTLKNNSGGGRLVLPEYGIAFPQNDCDLVIFDGAKIIHGVTPIVNSEPDSYRISLISYNTKTR